MSVLRRRRKTEPKKNVVQAEALSELRKLVGEDGEMYEALASTMFLNPKNIEHSMKEAADFAKKAKDDGDRAKAGMWYAVAGGMAIYEGNVKKVLEYYSEAEKITGKHYGILKTPEKAVAIAQEYYKNFLPA